MSKIEGRYNTKYPNLPTFHGPLYSMRGSSLLKKEQKEKKEEENKQLFCSKVATKFQYILYIISLYIPT